MDLTKYKVKKIILPDGEHMLGRSAEILDEGSFYRIDGTYIIDKHKIISITEDTDRIKVKMKDMEYVFMV